MRTSTHIVLAFGLLGCEAHVVGSTETGVGTSRAETQGEETRDDRADDGNVSGADTESTSTSTETTSTTSEATTDDGSATVITGDTGGSDDGDEAFACQIGLCDGNVYECGDCIDNDGDGLVDAADPSCWGPCDNNESGWKGNIPGSGPHPCLIVDCYFDLDKGHGNDDCYWSQSCDPLEPSGCTYNPDMDVSGTISSCVDLEVSQSEQCHAYCGPLTPNGCDCFGCCEIPTEGGTVTVYLGSEDTNGQGSCSISTVDDPSACLPCTQVPACLNPCEPANCEICIGQTMLPEGCREPGCSPGVQPCLPEHESGDCPEGSTCITGCCTPFPT
jgi:hypothetical protein